MVIYTNDKHHRLVVFAFQETGSCFPRKMARDPLSERFVLVDERDAVNFIVGAYLSVYDNVVSYLDGGQI